MASIPDKNMVRLPGFRRGIDNVSSENDVRSDALRQAVNVDLGGSGKPGRRTGYTLLGAGDYHSLYTPDNDQLYGVVGGDLCSFDENMATTVRVAGVGSARVAYALAASQVYWTSPTLNGAFAMDGTPLPMWPQNPPAPVITASSVGGLEEGQYQVVITVRDIYGRESGGSLATVVQVPAGGGLQLSSIPNLTDYARIRVYVTARNGTELFHADDIPMGQANYLIGVGRRGHALGGRQWWQPMPTGQDIEYAAGRLWIAKGPYLYFSEPLAYGAYSLDNVLKFNDTITLLAGVGEGPNSGLYVGAGKRTLYLAGPDPKTANLTIARPAGAIAGTKTFVHTSTFSASLPDLPQTTAALWISADGVFCLGLPTGQVLPLTQRRVALPTEAAFGAAVLRDDNGRNQMIATLEGGDQQPRAAASDQISGTIYRGGIEVN